MKILMVSPHPTYSPRGTPISVLNRCRALCALGHEIDLVTYGIGTDVPVAGLRYLRAPVPGIHSVKVGPSAAKLPLDAAVMVKAAQRLYAGRGRYDVLHTHEEAGVLGMLPGRRGLPHVYDMGNDLEVVLTNYGFGPRNPLTRFVAQVERQVCLHADVVIAHFPSIADRVRALTAGRVPAQVIANTALEVRGDDLRAARLRRELGVGSAPLVVYTGTLEPYQGVELVVDALAFLRAGGQPVHLLVVGGRPDQQRELVQRARAAGVDDLLVVRPVVPQEEVPDHLRAGDVLVSPRSTGTNTPLKIFSYLRSRRPVVATRIESHLQVLDEETAALVEPTAEGLAGGIAAVLADLPGAAARAERAGETADRRFGLEAFVTGAASAYAHVGGEPPAPNTVAAAVSELERALAGASDGLKPVRLEVAS